jgi:predicted RNA-binding protein with RPS1 domain
MIVSVLNRAWRDQLRNRMSNDPAVQPDVTTSIPASEAASTSVAPSSEHTTTDDDKPRIKIGSQRDGGAPTKVPPRVITEFKTTAPATKQVFVQLDQQGNFQPLATPAAPTPAATTPAPAQRPPQQQQGQRNRGPRREQTEETSGEQAASYKAKPQALTPNVNQPAKGNSLFSEQRSGPRVEVPTTRGQLSDDLEAELAAALGEDSSLNEMIDQSATPNVGATLAPETKCQARVLSTTDMFVFLELPGYNQGALPAQQIEGELPAVGSMLEVMVNRYSADEGLYEVSVNSAAVSVSDWSQVNEGMVVEARVTGHNKGGLECEVNRLRGFMPAGQISIYRVENLEQFVGQKMNCVVTEANPDRRNLILSARALMERDQAAAKEKLLAEIEVGQEREAVVRSLRDFGAFCDLGGIDGLIHISQMSWERVRHPKDLLEEGQKVKVKIQKIDPQTGKISLSLRDFHANPWASVAMKYPVSSIVKATVSRVMEFGAFIKLEPGVEGLVHVSELSYKRVWRVSDALTEGQEVEAKVLSIDVDAQRMSLSIKALEAKPAPAPKEGEAAAEPAVEEVPAPVKRSNVNREQLKGGLGKPSGGEQFGLKW